MFKAKRIIRKACTATVAAAAIAAGSLAARADAVEDFYKGKTLRIVIGYAVGGGYDIYGRVFAEGFSKYLPGNPTIIAQNMPGGGSFVAAKYLYGAAPRDGTYFGSVSQTLALDAAMNEDPNTFDVTKLSYLGRLLDNVDVGAGMPGAKFKTFDDARKMEIVVGATGGASPGYLVPAALQKFAGAKFKIVSGYGGSADVYLAAERKEVELIGSVGLTFIMQRSPEWIREKKAPILYQTAIKRHPLIPDVPAIGELGVDPEGAAVLRAIGASSEIGRSIITTPGVPPERLAALRAAFQKMVNDPVFIEGMKKREIPIFGATGEEMDDITKEVMKTPPKVLEMTKALLKQ
ncbi:MAG: extra-cytoplasmic solute receptor [Hyphomicrobiales bacterium]|jgi:tripartite-type tricarboxylate transporter receptor subunit TctC|nr:extra-cytoplasmic solute receptor [Hyphomicrobiales bacterium]